MPGGDVTLADCWGSDDAGGGCDTGRLVSNSKSVEKLARGADGVGVSIKDNPVSETLADKPLETLPDKLAETVVEIVRDTESVPVEDGTMICESVSAGIVTTPSSEFDTVAGNVDTVNLPMVEPFS